VAPDKQPADRV